MERKFKMYEITPPQRQLVHDPGYIENVNWVMLMGLEYEYDIFGKEVVCEDGRITRVMTKYKEIAE